MNTQIDASDEDTKWWHIVMTQMDYINQCHKVVTQSEKESDDSK